MKHVISMRDLSKAEILKFMEVSRQIEAGEIAPDMQRKVAALMFYEPSTRTHFSFATAMKKLNGQTITMRGTVNSSVSKGETFADTLQTIAQYADIIVIRTGVEGSARYASEIVDVPVINAGDGANQHPTQALLDLYSIIKSQGTLENLKIGIAGDLKFGRTVHSLVQAMREFNPSFQFISPSFLRMPEYIKDDLKTDTIPFEELSEIDAKIDITITSK